MTEDDIVIVGVYFQLIDKILPTLYTVEFNSKDTIGPLVGWSEIENIKIPNIIAPMSLTLRGSLGGDDFVKAIGFPSIDSVFLYYAVKGGSMVHTMHRSTEKGVNFGQAVTLAANNTYGVLSSALATPPWSTGRVQVRCVFSSSYFMNTNLQ